MQESNEQNLYSGVIKNNEIGKHSSNIISLIDSADEKDLQLEFMETTSTLNQNNKMQSDTNPLFQIMKNANSPKKSLSKSSSKQKKTKTKKLATPKTIDSGSRFLSCPSCNAPIHKLLISEHVCEKSNINSNNELASKNEKKQEDNGIDISNPPSLDPHSNSSQTLFSVFQLLAPQPASAFQAKKKRKTNSHNAQIKQVFSLQFHNNWWIWNWSKYVDEESQALKVNEEENVSSKNSSQSKFPKPRLLKQNEIQWRGEYLIKIFNNSGQQILVYPVTNIPPLFQPIDWNSKTLAMNSSKSKFHFPISILKSMLQKCVRRCEADAAVRIALELISQNFQQFVRRLSIIMIEDSILHPALPLLVWLSSCPEYSPTEQHINMCLQIVYELATCPFKDIDIESSLALSSQEEVIPSFDEIDEELPSEEASLIKSILNRASFGGMVGDVAMLKRFAYIWYKRFRFNKPPVPSLQNNSTSSTVTFPRTPWLSYLFELYKSVFKPVVYQNVGPIILKDCLTAAIDFHCSSIIEDCVPFNSEIYKKVELSLQEIYGSSVNVFDKLKSAMWKFRSSTNHKKFIFPVDDFKDPEKEKLYPIWVQVESLFEEYSLNLIQKKYS